MKLESGPAAYDRNYYLVFFILCAGLGGYFYYDYTIGYVKKNREAAHKSLAPLIGADKLPEKFPASPTRPEFQALIESNPTRIQDVYDKIGQPLARVSTDDGVVVEYFVSDYGRALVSVTNGGLDPTKIAWTTWFKTKEEIKLQFYCAIVCFAVGLYVLTRVFRAATLRAVIDDEGMTYAGRRIPFDNMTRLCDYNRKGWVDLYYDLGAQERKLRIDNQKIRKFDEIVDALCKAKGFDDPHKATEKSAGDS